MIKKNNLIPLVFIVLIIVCFVAALFQDRKKAAELVMAEEMARQRNNQVIADTEWPEGFSGSRRDSFRFATEQDKARISEDLTIRLTIWPENQVFVDREDSLKFALNQDEENRKRAEEKAREDRRRASFTWSTTYFVDEWGDRSTNGAKSQQLGPVTQMGWPYGDVQARVFVQCTPRMAWLRFTSSPNLTGDETKSGYSVSHLSVRLDGQTTRWRVTQDWGDNDLNLPRSAINAFRRSKTFEIVLPWYGEGNVRFKWDLTGSSEMISEACG